MSNSPQVPPIKLALDNHTIAWLRDTRCAVPGKIDKYDAKLGTASVLLQMQEKNLVTGVITDYPAIYDVPVHQLSGGTGGVNMVISKGDDCLVIFGDRDIDNWYATGSAQVPNSARVHSLADGFAIVGVRPLTNPPVRPDYLATGIYRDSTQVSIKNNKAAIKNATTDLKTILDAIISHINSIVVTTSITSFGTPTAGTVTFGTPAPVPSDLLYTGDVTTP